MSTAFSGVGAPETALLNICQYLVFILAAVSLSDFDLCCLWSLDMNRHCQDELLNSQSWPELCISELLIPELVAGIGRAGERAASLAAGIGPTGDSMTDIRYQQRCLSVT